MRMTVVAALVLLAGCREAEQPNGPPPQDMTAAVDNRADPSQAGAVLGAAIAGEQAKTLMHERHEGMEDIGDAMKVVGRELKGDNPDMAKVRAGAGTIARLAPQVTGWFPPGTGPEAGKTHAKPEIWQNPKDFAAKRATFQQAARDFNVAAGGSDLKAIRAAHADLGKSCKACHDLYREKDD